MLKIVGEGPKWLTWHISWAEGKNKQYVESSNEAARELEAWERLEQEEEAEQGKKEGRAELIRRVQQGKKSGDGI